MGSEYLLRAYENSGMGYQSLDKDGKIIEANEMWCSMLGYQIDEVIGRWFGDLLSDHSRVVFSESFPVFKEEGMVSDVPMELVHKDGTVIDMKIDGKASFLADGVFDRTHCVCRYANSVFTLDSSYQNPVHHTDIPLVVFDSESFKFVDVNNAACRFYGYSYREFLKMTIFDINVSSEERVRMLVQNVLKGNMPNFRVEHITASGKTHMIEPKPSKLVYNDRTYIMVLMIDVTDEAVKEKRLTALLDLSKKLLEPTISLREVAKTVLAYAQELTKSTDGYVATIDQVTKDINIHTFTDMMSDCKVVNKGVKFKLDKDGNYPALFGHSLNTGESFYENNPKSHPASTGLPQGHIKIENALFYSVMLQDNVVGQIALANCPGGFNDEDMQIVKEIATIYALAIKGYEQSAEEYKFQEIFNSIVEGVFILSPVESSSDFLLMDMNRAAIGITGLNYDDVKGKSISKALPGLDEEVLKTFQQVAENGTPQRLGLRTYKDDRVIFVSDSYIFRMPTGYIVSIFRDLTELHSIQDELKDLNEKLLDKVEEEIGIRRKQEQVIYEQKKLADLGQMINAIAHQWRQPINVLGLYAQEVVDMYKDGELTDDYIDEFYGNTMDLVTHLSSTIDDFRYFFKSEKERTEFEIVDEVLNLVKLVKVQLNTLGIKVLVSCECTYKGTYCTDLETTPNCECKASKINGYKGEFRQVLMNLISNASDALRDAIDTKGLENGVIKVHIICTKRSVSVQVADNGLGVPDDIIGKIFNPYFTTKDEGKGTGIGLYMSKMVVEDHMGGTLNVANDNGAVFTVKLPKNG